MELIRGWCNLRPRHRGCVATVGNFDGVHLGHRALLAEVVDRAHHLGVPATLVSFEPLTGEFFARADRPARLTTLAEKILALADTGIERLVVLRFDARFAALEPSEFIARLLVAGLEVRHLVIGDDFRFGHRGAGDLAMLRRAGARHGFEVSRRPTWCVGAERVSSTRIRSALAGGDLAIAEALLGRPYATCGRVVPGRRLGREIGFPTANIPLHRRVCPVSGVFAVRVRGAGLRGAPGVANVGVRPTVDGTQKVLEVHLLDSEAELYRQRLEVGFVARLRGERRFESLAALQAQIGRDVAAARATLAGSIDTGRRLQA